MRFALNEAVVQHPIIVVLLGEVLVAGVAYEDQYILGYGLFAAIFQRCRQQRAAGGPAENTFAAQQFARGEREMNLSTNAVNVYNVLRML
mgnify:CR=1 FL=1